MKDLLSKIIYRFFSLFPVKKKKILFQSYYGANYGCNPKYLSEYIVSHYPDKFKVVWSFIYPSDYKEIAGIKKVKHGGIPYSYHLATAGTIIHNYRMDTSFRKRKGQLYIQTWHSSLRLKMIEADAEETISQHYKEMAIKDSMQIDLMVSGCKFSTDIFKRAFWYNGKILNIGTPRIDIFYKRDNDIKNKVRRTLGIDNKVNILLYAPTFRDNHSLEYYDVDVNNVLGALKDKFGKQWIMVIRLHPHLQNLSHEMVENYDGRIIDATSYDDIQELLYASDALITDYSSLVFDFMFTKRPIWLYASDYKEYIQKERGVYFDISSLPFSLSQNNKELIDNIYSFNQATFESLTMEFKKNIGSFEKGDASKSLAEKIIRLKSL